MSLLGGEAASSSSRSSGVPNEHASAASGILSDWKHAQQDLSAAGPGPGSAALQAEASTRHANHHQSPQGALRVYKLLAAGALAGAVSRTSTAPMDRLKMIMQIEDVSKKGMTIKEGITKMQAEGSMRAFFRGNGANVVKIAPETALKLTLNDTFKQFMAKQPDSITPAERMAAGGIAGAVAQFLTYPLDTIRTRLAVSAHRTYSGILHAAYCMRRDEGIVAFYRGLAPSMIGILPYAGVDIALFEIFKQHLLDKEKEKGKESPPRLKLFAAGMLSSSIAQVASYPLALIRTRLQAQGVGGGVCKYHGMADVLRKTLEHEGFLGLYKGLLPNICKLAPAAGIGWYVFEETKILLGEDPKT
ncbi:mitochondrial substrate carrier [Dunaliella salina]|uniref:Mitochondrial substrate carrier n=1 Tax=Dunaliella salina TaxID=3046 RepID=A0ABZ3KCQ8_DUNSA|nr:mitochondrial substrate carrier [Dunaliella salina]|eukprot:KAF5826956.1 mitochondrial substrate carrier [Dunaliella salina]